MRFSVWPSPQRPWPELLDRARKAEAGGWHGLWFADHYMADSADGEPNNAPVLECWAVLAALAGAVPRLQLGSLVSPSTVHHPAILAKRAATIDQASGGRLVVGVGAGWQVNEHRAYGIDLLEAKPRVDRFAEFLEILHGLLHEERTTLSGTHFTVTNAPCEPKGANGVIPIMVGTAGPRMLRLTARFAEEWNTWGTPERVREVMAALDRACESVGRDPATVRRTAQAFFVISDDPAAIEATRARLPADRIVAGSTAQVVDQVGEYQAAGLDELIVPDFNLGRTPEARDEAYERFWTDIAAPFVA